MKVMFGTDAKAAEALAHMAKASGTDVAGFKSQLATTKMYSTPQEAYAFMMSPAPQKTMDLVRTFSFTHGLLGKGAKSADESGHCAGRRQGARRRESAEDALRCELHEARARRQALTHGT